MDLTKERSAVFVSASLYFSVQFLELEKIVCYNIYIIK